jgi:glycosyltransferase involved in cell wall biosynthesis
MTKLINLTVGTDIDGMGGIATVLNVYKDCGFFEKYQVKLIKSHSSVGSRGPVKAGLVYLYALLQVVFYYVFYRVGVTHIHMASRGSYFRKSIVVRLVKLLGGKVILHLHGAEFKGFYECECTLKKQEHIRNTFEMADTVIVLSTQWIIWAREILSKSDHLRVLYNAVPQLSLNRGYVHQGTIAFLGRVGHRKGVHDLIHAFVKVKANCVGSKLLIAGDGDIEKYQQLANQLGLSDSLQFLGWIAGEEKLDLLTKTDIYCLPSYNEGFPMGVLEAMSAGIPVVASKAGGIPDAIENGEEGILFDAGDVEALSEALICLIKNRSLNESYQIAAREKFNKNFSTDAIIPQLESIYSQLQV